MNRKLTVLLLIIAFYVLILLTIAACGEIKQLNRIRANMDYLDQ